MQCIWLFIGFNPCPCPCPINLSTTFLQPFYNLSTTFLQPFFNLSTFPSRRLTSKEPFLHFIQDYISIYGKKSRCQPDELNNRNKWRKFTKELCIDEVPNYSWICAKKKPAKQYRYRYRYCKGIGIGIRIGISIGIGIL